MARLLFVFRHGPHGSERAREGLDAALAALAFDHRVDALVLGEGVLALKPGHDTAAAGMKDFAPGFGALARHGLERAVASRAALDALGLAPDGLALRLEVLADPALGDFIAEHDAVLAF